MKVINRLIGVIFSIFIILVLCVKLLYLRTLSLKLVAVLFVGLVIIALLVKFSLKNKSIKNFYTKIYNKIKSCSITKILITVFLVSSFVKILGVFVFQIDSPSGNSDIMGYMKCAEEMVSYGQIKTFEMWIYYFPYLFWYSLFITPPVMLFGSSCTAVSIYLSIINSVTITLFASVIATQFSKTKAVTVSALLIFLPSQIIIPQCIIHEQALLFFLSISFWLYFVKLPNMKKTYSKIIVVSLFFISLLLAKMVNGGAIIVLIAFAIYFVIKYRGIVKRIIFPAIMICFVILSSGVINKIPVNFTSIDPNQTPKEYFSSWSYYVGLNTENSGGFSKIDSDTYGWNKYDMNTTGLSGQELIEYRKGLLNDRLKERLDNPGEFVFLEYSKFCTEWQVFDFPFYFVNSNNVNPTVNSVFHLCINFEIIIMICLVLIAVVNMILNYKKQISDLSVNFILKLYMMGMTAALLLIECNNKYAYIVNTFLIIYSVCSLNKSAISKLFKKKDRCKNEEIYE